jgi:hypothetical protein
VDFFGSLADVNDGEPLDFGAVDELLFQRSVSRTAPSTM